MARVRSIPASELPPELAAVYEHFAEQYGPFRNQAAVFAHVPAALRHLMAMLIELRETASLPKRVLDWRSSPYPGSMLAITAWRITRRFWLSREFPPWGSNAFSIFATTRNSMSGTNLLSSMR